MAPTARALYLQENLGMWALPVEARCLYLHENQGIWAHPRLPIDTSYQLENSTNDEIFPWIEKISPMSQKVGGGVDIFGDGFGATQGEFGSTIKIGSQVMPVTNWYRARGTGLYPCNAGGVELPVLRVTVPPTAASGFVLCKETL